VGDLQKIHTSTPYLLPDVIDSLYQMPLVLFVLPVTYSQDTTTPG